MVVVSDSNGRTDGSAYDFLQKINTPLPIVLVSWVEDFVFNPALLSVTDYVLVCVCEYGWDFVVKDSHVWGFNTYNVRHRYSGVEWDKFDNWVKENPPKILFKRELLKKDVSSKVKPFEYPCLADVYPMQLREDFDKRPINVYQYWGRSNECRLRIHAEILRHSFIKGFQACDNMFYIQGYINQEQGEKWITLWIPHYHRVDIKHLLQVNGLSKLSLSWPGAGFKCFRTSEAPVNSVMVMHKNDYAWAYDWDETNCILVEPEKEIEGIEVALKNSNLYDIYLKGVQNVDNYRVNNYINNYILPIINNA